LVSYATIAKKRWEKAGERVGGDPNGKKASTQKKAHALNV
jgi:hypothetical protein